MLVAMSSNLEQMDASEKSKTPMPMSMGMPVNMVAQQVPSTNKQSAQVDMLPRFYSPIPVNMATNPYQLAFTSEQRMQMGLLTNIQSPTPAYMGFQQLSSTSSFPSISVQNPMYANAASLLSASKKRPVQRQAPTKLQSSTGINQGSQQLSSTNKRPSQAEPSAKVQTESFESVRSKLRESLAASLAMVPEHQNKPQASEKNSPKGSASTATQAEVGTGSVELTSTTSNHSACRNYPETLASNEHNTKSDAKQDVPRDASLNGDMGDQEVRKHDAQEDQTTHASLESDQEVKKHDAQGDQATHASIKNEALFSSNLIINDDLLLGHGLSWASDVDDGSSEIIMNQDLKRPKLLDEEVIEKPKLLYEEVTGNSKEAILQKNAETLAIKIEAELFKLFGGVNKKYKEKGRSLLFNLKDRNNPELRERVLSGDIAPKRLCSMTAEELASKELSQWRLAKAEELAQMVVLPDSEVDIRRLVRKTHKGEFQVEVDQDDSVSVEVAVGETVLSRLPSKASGVQTQSKTDDSEIKPMLHETRASEGLSLPEKGDLGEQNDSSNLDALLCEKTDFMQDIMVDELKDSEFLPPIVSLDEFMQDLDSEPPFDNLSLGTNLCENNSDNVEPEMDPESDSSEPKSDPELDNLTSKLDSSEDISGSKLSPPNKNDREEIAMGNTSNVEIISRPTSDIKSSSVTPGYAEPGICLPDIIRSRSEQIWEGMLQLNIAALASAICFFRSGEKTSTQEWPAFLEIKGRVRLDAFEKFLQELRLSRSRAIMLAQFCWKEGSHESGHSNMCETINSYIADQRVGFAEPSPGVELYFCPPHPKTTEMLETHLPRDHTEILHSNKNDGLIGVVVWRRPYVTTISPRMSSHHKRKHSSSRKHQTITNSKSCPDDEPVDDVPPGFGPGSRNARDEDDLPEFNFVHGSTGNPRAPSLPPPLARPVEQMRELIEKYGKGSVNTNKSSWNDDDIPEWQPNSNPNQPQQLPPPPQLLPPPVPQPHNNNYQQQPFVMNQNQLMPLAVPQPMPLQPPPMLHPQLGFMQGQLNNNVNPQMGYVQGQLNNNVNPQLGFMQVHINNNVNPMWLPSALGGQMTQPCHLNFSGQPANNGQFYGAPVAGFGAVPGQNFAMGWRPDVPRDSGV